MATKSASGGNLMGLSREDDSDRVAPGSRSCDATAWWSGEGEVTRRR